MFELTDPAFHQAIRDMGYGEIQYVNSGPWYTKADCQRMLEHSDTPAEERMCAQWVLNEMAREEAEQAEREKANAQGGVQNDNEKEEAKTEVGVEEEKEKEEVQDGVKYDEEGFSEWLYYPQPTSSAKEMKQGS